MMRLHECNWPKLAEPYFAALREAVSDVFANVQPVGIVATGTIVRGTPDPSSDLDVYVVHDQPERRRWQKFYKGVPAEIFINPADAIRRYFIEEHEDGRPITAHMLATGHVVFFTGPSLHDLRSEANAWLGRRVTLTPEQQVRKRYAAATHYEDAVDVLAQDPQAAVMLLHQAVTMMIRYRFLISGEFIPRQKDLLRTLRDFDPELGKLVDQFVEGAIEEKAAAAAQIADLTVRARGFFEWDSGWEAMLSSE